MRAFPFTFDGHIVMYPHDINCKLYIEKHEFGIYFYDDEGSVYNLHCNVSAGNWCRIIINHKSGETKDLPFHEGTWHFLPEEIKIEKRK